MIALLLVLQASQPVPSAQAAALAQPDIQLHFSATARRVVIDREGDLDLRVYGAVNGREGQNNLVEVHAPEVPQGRTRLNNVRVDVRAEARLPDVEFGAARQEPATPR